MAGMTPQDSADAAQQAADAARVAAEQAQVLADHARLLAEQASYSGGADPLVFQISIFVMAVLLGACTVLAGRGGELRSIGAGAMLALAVTAAGGIVVAAQAGSALTAGLGLAAVALSGAVAAAMVLVMQDRASGGGSGQ
jgi:hypothetical protein